MEGQAIFVCPECGEHFTSVDIDYRNTNHAIPMACPKCGTRTLDKYWNQTGIPDWGIFAIVISCFLVPYLLWRGFQRWVSSYFYKEYFQSSDNENSPKKQEK